MKCKERVPLQERSEERKNPLFPAPGIRTLADSKDNGENIL
jgi:hypothetical protein